MEPARAGVCPVQVKNHRRPGSRVRLTLGTEVAGDAHH
ncbi:hypothetical protein ACLK2C_01035 [Escherichia coli]